MTTVFLDRDDAGLRIAESAAEQHWVAPVVFGIARGGVPVAAPVARRLGAPLCVAVARKVAAPGQPELGVGAVTADGPPVFDERGMAVLGLTPDDLADTVERERAEARRRLSLYRRAGQPPSVAGTATSARRPTTRSAPLCPEWTTSSAEHRFAVRHVRLGRCGWRRSGYGRDMSDTREVALVTGASRGLGLLLAREFAVRGFDLVICARSPDGLDAAREDLERTGARVLQLRADVSVRTESEGVVAAAVQHFGRLDVVVNNAGVIQVGPAVTMDADQFATALDTMLWGPVHTSLAAIPVMRERGRGRIVNVTSLGARVPAPHLLPYTTAKFAARGFSEGLAVELGKYGISVTTAVPGLMRTGSPRNALFTGDRSAEFRWFTLGDSLPLLSMDAERAAAKIVSAALRGRAEIVLTPAAKLAGLAHGIAPGTTTRLAALADRLLPRGEDTTTPRPGHLDERDQPAWFTAATRLTRIAARRFHQHQDATSPS